MKARLLSTVAASLLLAAGAASAQSLNKEQAPARAPAAQQSAPAEKVAPPMNARKGAETTGQASQDMKLDAGKATTGQAPKADAQGKADMKSSTDVKASDSTKGAADTKSPSMKSSTDMKSSSDTKSGAAMDSNANKTQDNAQGTTSTQSSTTGQGAAAGMTKLSTEQQTKITTTFKSAKIESVPKSQLNVSIAVGTKIPATVRYSPIPAEVVAVYPQWRGYYVILVDGQYVIIEPRTREIVYILV